MTLCATRLTAHNNATPQSDWKTKMPTFPRPKSRAIAGTTIRKVMFALWLPYRCEDNISLNKSSRFSRTADQEPQSSSSFLS